MSTNLPGVPAGSPVSMVLAWLLIALLAAGYVYVLSRLFRKAGYSGWWSLLMLVSPVNLIVLIYLAFTKWPIERDIEWYRQNTPDAEAQARRMLEDADHLRTEFKFDEAKAAYRDVVRLFPASDAAQEAHKSLDEMRMDELRKP